MELLLHSRPTDGVSTQGELSIDGAYECETQELPYTDGSVGGAIPPGRYQVILQPSPHFEADPDPWVQRYARRMPHIVGIPGRDLIMLHWGNYVTQIKGCVEVGRSLGADFIGTSRPAFEQLYGKIEAPADAGDCRITVQRD